MHIDRVITAIGKHIVAREALAGGSEGVSIDKSTDFGIIVAGLEAIQACFSMLGTTPVNCFSNVLSAPIGALSLFAYYAKIIADTFGKRIFAAIIMR